MRLTISSSLPALLVLVLAPSPATAAMVGTPFSSPVTADPAAIFWNPAAMTLLTGTQGMLQGALVPVRVEYQRDYLDAQGRPYPRSQMLGLLPDAFAGGVTDGGGKLGPFRLGIGAAVPLVDGADWSPTTKGQPAPSRYYSLQTFLAWLTISPAVGLRINRYLAVGAGLDVTAALVSSEMVLDFGARINQVACKQVGAQGKCPTDAPLPREDPTFDAPMSLHGTGWGLGAFVGLLLTPTPWFRLGVVLHTGAGEVKIPVSLQVQIPAAARQYLAQNLPSVNVPSIQADGTLEVHGPMMVAASACLAPSEQLELNLELQWMDKSSMSIFNVDLRPDPAVADLLRDQVMLNAFSDFWSVGLRGQLRPLRALTGALGLSYEPNTRPDALASPLTVDMHKLIVRAGIRWQPARRVSVVLDYAHIFTLARQVGPNLYHPNANPTTPVEEALDHPVPSGRYTAAGDRVGLALLLHLD